MPKFSSFTFPSCGGKNDIFVLRCDPDGEVRGTVQIAHGIAEHSGRYRDFMSFLAENGFAVFANDHLGHGQSARSADELGFFAENGGWEIVVGDMHQLHERIRDEFPDVPCFLFGHSMGSFLSRTYIIRYRTGLDGVVLSGTGQQPAPIIASGRLAAEAEIKLHGPRYKSQRLNDLAFGKYNDAFAPARTVSDWLSRDEASVDEYISDPLCGYIPSAGLFCDMMKGLAYIGSGRNIARMRKSLPVLFVSGDSDPVGGNGRGVMHVYSCFVSSGMRDVTLKLYHDCRHELVHELNRDEICADILDWLNAKARRA